MSYILDALRRADAERERERDGVPGLDAQVNAPLPADEAEPPRRRGPWPWVVLGLSAGLLLAIGWRLLASDDAPAAPSAAPEIPVVAKSVDTTPAPREPAVAPAGARPRSTLPEPMNPALDAQAEEAMRRRAAAPTASAPAVPGVAESASASASASVSVSVSATASSRAGIAPNPAAPAPAEPEARIVAFAELPEAVRRELPALTVGGATYSEHPGSRLLILNGQLQHEGDKPAPGLTLLQIQLKSALFDYKGTRFRLSY